MVSCGPCLFGQGGMRPSSYDIPYGFAVIGEEL